METKYVDYDLVKEYYVSGFTEKEIFSVLEYITDKEYNELELVCSKLRKFSDLLNAHLKNRAEHKSDILATVYIARHRDIVDYLNSLEVGEPLRLAGHFPQYSRSHVRQIVAKLRNIGAINNYDLPGLET